MAIASSARLLLPAVLLAGACTQDQDILVLSPKIVISPESLDFGEVVVTTSQQGWIEIINDGLKLSLDYEAGGDLAQKLAALYDYMTSRLLYANLHSSRPALDEVAGLLRDIKGAWESIGTTV